MGKIDKKAEGRASKHDQEVFGTNSEIARSLRSYYGTLVSDDVPDRFMDLLNKLESAESAKKKD